MLKQICMGVTSIIAALNLQRLSGGQATIVIRIFLDRQVVYTEAVGTKLEPVHWDSENRQVLKTYR